MKTFLPKTIKQPRYAAKRYSLGFAMIIPLLLIAIIAAGAGIYVGVQTTTDSDIVTESEELKSLQAKLENSLVLPSDFKQVPEFTLLDKNANTVSADSLKGQWNMVFFGFTHCPDVCPLTLSTMADAVKQISALDEELPIPNIVFVSVDPKRDTPEGLKSYVEYFNPDFKALTGTLNQMYELINPLNVVVTYTVDEENENEYSVDHTASIMLIDPALRLRGKFNAPHKATEIATDYQTIINHLI